jgi:hypothetical protein
MITIHKYPIPVTDEFMIKMPGAHQGKILCVQCQREEPMLWVLVDTALPLGPRRFSMRGTGHPAEGVSPKGYVGSFQMRGGSLVFHLFECQ